MDKDIEFNILSVDRDFEESLKSDRNFLFSHFGDRLSLLTPAEVSGIMLEPKIIGKGFDFFENSVSSLPINNFYETTVCLDYFFKDDSYLIDSECLQPVLKSASAQIDRAITGLTSIITFKGMAQKKAKGNVVAPIFEFEDYQFEVNDYIDCPTYLSFVKHNFLSSMQDASSFVDSDVPEDKICMYMPFVVRSTGELDKSHSVTVSQSNWFNKIIRHFSQGHYQLVIACDQAKKHPYAFCLLLACILGVDYKFFSEYKSNDGYARLTTSQKIDFVRAIKPLIENVSFEFFSGSLVSL